MTVLTYRDRDQKRTDRRQQEELLAALDAAPSQLHRDQCGSWVIAGRRGTIHTWGDGKTWVAYVIGRSTRHWTAIKQRPAFMTVTQDGDEEGCLRLFGLPTPQEAVLIRDVMGLRKRVDYAPGTLERKRASMAKAAYARESARAPLPGVAMPEEVFGRFKRQGGLTVDGGAESRREGTRMTDASRGSRVEAGVSGRFRAQDAPTTPRPVPDTTPTGSHKEFPANVAINAADVTEPEEVA